LYDVSIYIYIYIYIFIHIYIYIGERHHGARVDRLTGDRNARTAGRRPVPAVARPF
jgi:hypothetical protein